MKKRINRKFILLSLLIFVLLSLTLFSFTRSEDIRYTEESKVEENSDLTYYLEVTYDGIDKKGINSDISSSADIKSGYIEVSDPIPEGLIFNGFVESVDGTFGAKDQYGGMCIGSVVDDTGEPTETETEVTYHGLHYNKETRMVTFKVRDLKAGCSLEVGIKTRTPYLGDKNRMDFYNTAFAKEDTLSVKSNTVHNWIQKAKTQTYNVIYEFENTDDEELIRLTSELLPTDEMKYPADTDLTILNIPEVEGYRFLGWTTTDATVINGSFKMPDHDVKFIGKFEKINKYTVTYVIEGDKPENYNEPSSKEYVPDAIVSIDSLNEGDIVNNYRFLGWTIENNVEMLKEYKKINGELIEVVSKKDFKMPEENVIIKGKFESVKYKVQFKFIGDVIPSEGDSLLPSTIEAVAGQNITIENVEDVEGYRFIGWNYDYEFLMPDHDVIIEGEWMIKRGLFAPTIKKELVYDKDFYNPGDVVLYKITITNTASFEINNVYIKENNSKSRFITDGTNNYNVKSNNLVEILSIPANGSISIDAIYKVTEEDNGTVTNEVEILSAESDVNDLDLSEEASKNYKASAEFKVSSKLNVCKNIEGKGIVDQKYQFHVTSTDEEYETWLNLGNDECRTIFVEPREYKIKEIVPQTH